MNELKTHEPGPWVLGGCSGRMITTPNGYIGDGFIADVDTLANAKLIAAAPELLEALQKLVEYHTPSESSSAPRVSAGQWALALSKAKTAIYKALNQ